MSHKISPERDRARQLYVESGGNVTLRDLAHTLDIPEKSVSVWKRRERWDELVEIMSNAKKIDAPVTADQTTIPPDPPADEPPPEPVLLTQKGQPAKRPNMLGKQNALGNRGGPGVPKGTQYALKHGLYSNLLINCTEEERGILAQAPSEPLERQRALIAQCEIRERRMYQRLASVCDKYDITLNDSDGMMPVHEVYTAYLKKSKETPNGGTVTRTKQNAITVILSIEDALTKLQKVKQEAINSLDRMLRSDVTLEYERRRLMVIESKEQKQTDVEDLAPLAQMLALPGAAEDGGDDE